jgi:hypothetical protein
MISRKDLFTEIKNPKEVEQLDDSNILGRIYSAIYMGLRLLLDIRSNQVKIAKHLGFELKAEEKELNEKH